MISNDRLYHIFGLECRENGTEMVAEGYAAKFEEKTVLYSYEGIDYCEIISRGAFDHALMTDVVLNYNHSGKPVARTKNDTLKITVDMLTYKR